MYNNKNTGIMGMIIVLVMLILLVIISNIKIDKLSYVENAVSAIVMPVQNGLTYLKNKLTGNNSFFDDVKKLKEENKNLEEKNSQLEIALRELEIVKAENSTLKEYVNLKEKYTEYSTVPADVINKDLTNYNNTIIINVGKKDGIKENMTVIADKGLVGYVLSVTENTAKVQTIVDTASVVSITVSTTRDTMLARGTLDSASTIKATYVPTEANLVVGDSVETSGIGGIFPKGIHIGTIKEVIDTKNITDRYATIETAVNFVKLETVLVIKN